MRHGATEEQIEQLTDYETGPFSDAEKVALELAKRITLAPRTVDDELMARLRAHWNDGEIVEIAAMAGMFNYLNRIAEAFDIEPTRPGEGL